MYFEFNNLIFFQKEFFSTYIILTFRNLLKIQYLYLLMNFYSECFQIPFMNTYVPTILQFLFYFTFQIIVDLRSPVLLQFKLIVLVQFRIQKFVISQKYSILKCIRNAIGTEFLLGHARRTFMYTQFILPSFTVVIVQFEPSHATSYGVVMKSNPQQTSFDIFKNHHFSFNRVQSFS